MFVCIIHQAKKTSRASTDGTFLPFMGTHLPLLHSTDKAMDYIGSLLPVLLHVSLLDCNTLIKLIFGGRH